MLEAQKLLETNPKFPQWKKQFALFGDEHSIWRSRGRIKKCRRVLLHQVSYSIAQGTPSDHFDCQKSTRESIPWGSKIHTYRITIAVLDCPRQKLSSTAPKSLCTLQEM